MNDNKMLPPGQAEVEKYRSAEQALSAQMAQLQQEMSTSKSQFEQEKAQMQTSLVVANSEADDLRRQLEAMVRMLASRTISDNNVGKLTPWPRSFDFRPRAC